jgi:hypothetical protein
VFFETTGNAGQESMVGERDALPPLPSIQKMTQTGFEEQNVYAVIHYWPHSWTLVKDFVKEMGKLADWV